MGQTNWHLAAIITMSILVWVPIRTQAQCEDPLNGNFYELSEFYQYDWGEAEPWTCCCINNFFSDWREDPGVSGPGCECPHPPSYTNCTHIKTKRTKTAQAEANDELLMPLPPVGGWEVSQVYTKSERITCSCANTNGGDQPVCITNYSNELPQRHVECGDC
jgi:hypothetical protein